MTALTLTVDMGGIGGRLREHQKQVAFIASLAVNDTAADVLASERQAMQSSFDRPTKWTLESFHVVKSNKNQGDILTAEVRPKEFGGGTPAWKYLIPEIYGGGRRKKSHERALERAGILRSNEYAVPGQGVPLDAHGNMPGSLITRILSAVRSSSDPMQNRSQGRRPRGRGKLRQAVYFVSRGRAGAPDGIYHRAGARAVPVIVFVRSPRYSPRFPFHAAAQRPLGRFVEHFHRHWADRRSGFN